MTSQRIPQYLTLTCKTPIPKLLFLIKSSTNLKNMAVIQPRPTHIPYQCAKFGDDWALFNFIFYVCYALSRGVTSWDGWQRRFLKVSPIRLRYCNLSFVVIPDTMGLRHIDNICEIVGKSYYIVRQSNDSRTMTYDFTMIAWWEANIVL